jgi:hypothetical protein
MHTGRRRLRSCAEWTVAATLLVGALALGLNLAGQVRRVTPQLPAVAAQEPVTSATPFAAVPSRAVSVPLLSLADDVRVNVGDVAADALNRIQGLVVAGSEAVERVRGGERVTREFAYPGGRFHLVTETRAGDAPRVTGIFVP